MAIRTAWHAWFKFSEILLLAGKGSCINPGNGKGKTERKPANQKLLSSLKNVGLSQTLWGRC